MYINQNIPIGCNVKCLACIPFLAPAKTKVFCMFDTMPFTKLQLPSEFHQFLGTGESLLLSKL